MIGILILRRLRLFFSSNKPTNHEACKRRARPASLGNLGSSIDLRSLVRVILEYDIANEAAPRKTYELHGGIDICNSRS